MSCFLVSLYENHEQANIRDVSRKFNEEDNPTMKTKEPASTGASRPMRDERAQSPQSVKSVETPFLSDIKTLRERAREHLEAGAIGSDYRGDVQKTIELLQTVLATEIVCVLRYTMHSIAASGISSDSVKSEFADHAKDEQQHAMAVAERINQLGGKPNFNPEGLATRSASEYAEGGNLVEMIKENLIAERIAVDHYRELIRYFGNDDPSTRVMIEAILRVEEEHADDMHDLLVAHEGRPMLK